MMRLATLLTALEEAALPAASPCLDSKLSGVCAESLAECLCYDTTDPREIASAWYNQLTAEWRCAVYDSDDPTAVNACIRAVLDTLLPLVPALPDESALQAWRDGDERAFREHIAAALEAATRTLSTVP